MILVWFGSEVPLDELAAAMKRRTTTLDAKILHATARQLPPCSAWRCPATARKIAPG